MRVITNHEQTALAVLHHLMAVNHGMSAGTDFGPAFINCISKAVMTNDQFRWLHIFIANGKGKSIAGYQSCRCSCSRSDESSSVIHRMNIGKKTTHFALHLNMPAVVDLNCDMGEGFPSDATIMPFISSANIACGAHAGNMNTMQQTVALALQHGVAIGAHPGYPDPENFGRKELNLNVSDIITLVATQINLIQEICSAGGARLRHVKPHGALYNLAARDRSVADAISRAVQQTDPELLLYGLSGSCSFESAAAHGLHFVHEVFADRTYTPEGRLTPRSDPQALVSSTTAAIEQVLSMILEKKVMATNGQSIPIKADTICIHGDGEHAAIFARHIHMTLIEKGITIKAPL